MNEFTSWSKKTSEKYPKQWHKLYNKLLNCFYDSLNNDRIFVHDEQYLTLINKSEKMPPDPNTKIFQQQLAVQYMGRNNRSAESPAKMIDGEEDQEPMIECKKKENKKPNSNTVASDAERYALHISNKYRVRLQGFYFIYFLLAFFCSLRITSTN